MNTLAMHRGIRSRSLAARIAFAASVGTVMVGCSERERPGFIADPLAEDAERAVSGSFEAPESAAGSGAAGVGAPSRDGGVGAPGSAVSGAGGAGATGPAAVTLHQSYEGRCEGATVQWGFFTFEAATPGDSSIQFRVRTAAAEAELESGSLVDLLTASAALGTDRCGFAGPAPCPIDLYDLLGGAPLAHHPFAELRVLLTPAREDGRMPAVEEWQLTYSCTFNQ